MPSTFTGSGIELIADGEQSGVWGQTTNDNLQIINRLVSEAGSIALSGTTHTLTIADGSLSDGQYGVLVFGGSPSGTNTVTISPNDAKRVFIVKNATAQSVVLTQGSGGNVTIPASAFKIVYTDGGGAGAAVVDVTSVVDINGGTIDGVTIGGASAGAGTFTTLTANGNVTLGDAATDTVTITADVASNIIPSADNTYDLGASGSEWKDLYIDGTANIDSLVADTADINGGTIDGTAIGAASASTGAFTTLSASSTATLNTLSSSGATITGGTINGTVIGGSTPAAISGTTGTFSGDVSIADKIVHTGDTNTAIRFPAADTVTVETAGAERVRVDSSGNVGIGTSSPNHKLTVAGYSNADAANKLAIGENADYQGLIYMESANETLTIENTSDYIARATIFKDNGTERMRIDGTGLGIGITPATTLHVSGPSVSAIIDSSNSNLFKLGLRDANAAVGFIGGSSAAPFVVGSSAGTERMRIDSSGNLLVGTSTASVTGAGLWLYNDGGNYGRINYGSSIAGTSFPAVFYNNVGSAVGSISYSTTTTTYATTSDYRLKEDVQPIVGSVDRLMALKPVNFAWKADGSRVDGFIAHEAQEVVPEAVTGSKDAVDKDGKPQYQGIDQSKIVPLLTAALQEALTEIADLKARVAALEA
jgi:hypothetical protein